MRHQTSDLGIARLSPVTADPFVLFVDISSVKSSTWLNFIALKIFIKQKKRIDRNRTQICNPQIWSLVPFPLGHTVFKGFHLSSLLAKLISYQRVLQWAPRKDDLFSFLTTFSFNVLLLVWQFRALPRYFFLFQKCTCHQHMYSWY